MLIPYRSELPENKEFELVGDLKELQKSIKKDQEKKVHENGTTEDNKGFEHC